MPPDKHPMKLIRNLLIACVSVGASLGCSTDVDPGQKVDAPGYYNGPMKGKSTPADGASTESKTKLDAE